ncbi:MAG: thiamine-phosphate kinase [Actinomycetota bacterium]
MDAPREQVVSDVGEIALVARIAAGIGSPPSQEVWSGDDAAVVEVGGARLLFTIDTLVEHADFDRANAGGADLGYKALAVTVSDIAAMGGRPKRAVVSLTVPSDTPVGYVDDIMAGLVEGTGRWGVGLVGGDLSGGQEISISVALVGEAPEAVLRSGARPGQALCVTGALGGSAGGLAVLGSGRAPVGAERELIRRHLRPEPRVEEGGILARAGCSAMIDVSDGLAVDLWRLAEASGVGCEVDDSLIPVDPALAGSGAVDDPLAAAVLGGEDYELLLTIDEDTVTDASHMVAAGLTRIGVTTDGARLLGGRSLDEWRAQGWEHLSSR